LLINIIKKKKCFIKINFNQFKLLNDGDWGLGIGDWGLGIGGLAQSPIPNPQSPIPNPQSPIIFFHIFIYKLNSYKFFII